MPSASNALENAFSPISTNLHRKLRPAESLMHSEFPPPHSTLVHTFSEGKTKSGYYERLKVFYNTENERE